MLSLNVTQQPRVVGAGLGRGLGSGCDGGRASRRVERGTLNLNGQVGDGQGLTGGREDGSPLQHVAQLAHVAGPGVGLQRGQGLAEEFTKEAKNQGLTVVAQEFTTDKAVDFSAILTNMKAKAPEAIFFGGYAPQAAPMARQMKALGMSGKLLGGDTVCSPVTGKLGGDAVNDLVFCAQGGSMLEKAESGPAFKAKFKQRFNVDADAYAASYYDQVMFIGQSMQKANSIAPDKVGAEIHKTAYKGVAATYSYDDKGNMRQAPITVFTFRNAVPVPLASY